MPKIVVTCLLSCAISLSVSAQSLIRAFQMGDWVSQNCDDLHFTSNGDVVVGGASNGRPDFDPGPGVVQLDTNVAREGFVARYDSTGNLIWVVGLEGGLATVTEIEEDASGNL